MWPIYKFFHHKERSYIICRKKIELEIRQSQKDKYILFPLFVIPRFYIDTINHVCICNLKVDMKLSAGIKGVNKLIINGRGICLMHKKYLYEVSNKKLSIKQPGYIQFSQSRRLISN